MNSADGKHIKAGNKNKINALKCAILLRFASSPASTQGLGCLARRNSVAVITVLTSTVGTARDEVRVLNTSGNPAQLFFASSRKTAYHLVP